MQLLPHPTTHPQTASAPAKSAANKQLQQLTLRQRLRARNNILYWREWLVSWTAPLEGACHSKEDIGTKVCP